MSTTKRLLKEKQKLKNMTKAELQQAIIKKKQCDAKALAIVEQLLEPNINPDRLLQNLRFLSKCHMEDVIEERTILKLCGYVLCSNPLTVVIQQQYHISTRSNKVYDISKRKKFCSSSCYGAFKYLFEQMLESPLWLRDKEDTPVFKILPINPKLTQHIPGDEIDIVGNNHSQNVTDNTSDNKRSTKDNTIKQTKENISYDTSNLEKNIHNACSLNNVNTKEDVQAKKVSINIDSQKLFSCEINSSELHKNPRNKDYNSQESIKEHHNDNTQKINVKSKNSEVESVRQSENILRFHEHNANAESKSSNENITCDKDDKTLLCQPDDTDNKNNRIKTSQSELDKICSSSIIISSDSRTECKKRRDTDKINKTKKCKQKESNNVEAPTDVHRSLIAHVEQSIREWITEDTLCLLLGEEDEKNRLLENLTQQERYQKVCKKLNRLQLEDKMKDRANLGKDTLKLLPDLSVLQEKGKKIELKVRAFYEGQITFPLPEDSNKESENKDDNDEPVLPITAEYNAPNVIRRRIFLDKLNTIVPDLLRTLMNKADVSSMMQYTHNNERYSLIKILINTFNLSAGNIVFKSGEWTLVGLIIIKMLSLIDAKLQPLLQSKQALMYTSMMLTLYKLDSNYLDRLVMEVINDMNTSKSNDKNY